MTLSRARKKFQVASLLSWEGLYIQKHYYYC